jgi:hypothetical protein
MISYHAGALLGTALSFVFYIVMFFLGRCVPALACVLLMVTFLNWVLSAFAFFLDRFHVPLLLIAVAIVAYTGTWPEADHTFDVFDVSANLPAPEALASIDPQRFIAIAASGGGIHAAGWTTQVLGGLYKELPSIELRKRLAHSIRVISPVSGGSVGSLYLLNAYRFADFREGRFGPEQIESYLFRPSVESSLEPMVQRMVFEDWWRTLMPGIPIATDRGRAAEQAWRDSIHIKEAAPSDDWLKQPLSEWAKLAASGVAPAVLFNTTIVDTGERAIFATADFSKSTKRHGRWTLRELYGKPLDTSLVTAARLSATFPVVSPSARASGVWPTRYRYHFVDGGYYDNYGMATLVEWLDDVFHARPSHGPIMLLQIKDSQDEEVASPRPAQASPAS